MSTRLTHSLDFPLPAELEAHEPPEARGLARDAVRLMVSSAHDAAVIHTRFRRLPDFLAPGDVLVVNTSATINAAFEAVRETGSGAPERITLHLSTELAERRWVVELRRKAAVGSSPLLTAEAGERLRLPGGGRAALIAPFRRGVQGDGHAVRLWIAELNVSDLAAYAARHGAPIRYGYVTQPWPLSYYQTLFSTEPGSAEMPSAGRAFTPALLRRLHQRGVRIAPVVLHAGVSSLEIDEPPYPERFRVPPATANTVNRTRAAGGRIIAVGTTALRALETVTSARGAIRPGHGWTELVITPDRGVFAVDALVTGWHAPGATHLALLAALAGAEHLERTYQAALRHGYLWHEFGDLHLLFAGVIRGPLRQRLSSGYVRVPVPTGVPGYRRESAPAQRMSISGTLVRRSSRNGEIEARPAAPAGGLDGASHRERS